jgi:autotransporter translocation and assembly factor TamB
MMSGASAEPSVPLRPADVRMLEENFGYIQPVRSNLVMSLYDASDLDLDVTLGTNTWVRQRKAPRLALELGGTARMKKAPHRMPDLFGRIAPVPGHGYVEQFARRFDFTGGEVQLNGPMTLHEVSIRAEYKSNTRNDSGDPDVVVKLDVTGRMDKLKLAMSSDPAMTETEIVSYITTGRTAKTASSTQNQGMGSEAADLALQMGAAQITGQFEDIAQEKIGLDVVQIRQDALRGATLVAGRYMAPRVYIGFRQPLQYKDQATSTSSNSYYRTQFEVEYTARNWLVFNVQGETSWLKSLIRARYAY